MEIFIIIGILVIIIFTIGISNNLNTIHTKLEEVIEGRLDDILVEISEYNKESNKTMERVEECLNEKFLHDEIAWADKIALANGVDLEEKFN